MKIIFWGKGSRGVSCLNELVERKFLIVLCVTHENDKVLIKRVRELGIPIASPCDPNSIDFEQALLLHRPDIFALCGYGKILKSNILKIPNKLSINLHGGRLPDFRGSSPMNWAIIRGEKEFTLSVIKVEKGVDTGDVLKEKSFPINSNDSINDLHHIANHEFPKMLVEVLEEIEQHKLNPREQKGYASSYFPLRFPDDGFILWDQLEALKIHQKIRALTSPYPPAFTFFGKRKVLLISSALHENTFYGEPGRVYLKSPQKGLLVCAKDVCLWVKEAVFEDDETMLYHCINRYDRFATVSGELLRILQS